MEVCKSMFLYKCVGFERRKICANVSNSIWYFLYQYRVFHSAQWSSVCSNLQFDHSMHVSSTRSFKYGWDGYCEAGVEKHNDSGKLCWCNPCSITHWSHRALLSMIFTLLHFISVEDFTQQSNLVHFVKFSTIFWMDSCMHVSCGLQITQAV